MAFKLKSALKFGQKGVFKSRTYNSPNKQKEQEKNKPIEKAGEKIAKVRPNPNTWSPDRKRQILKDWLMDTKGFNQENADRMIEDGAYNFKDVIKDMGMDKDVPAEPKNKGSEGKALKRLPKDKKVSQEDWEPAYVGADYSKEEIDKMTREEKEMKIDGYDPTLDPTQPEYKKNKTKKEKKKAKKESPLDQRVLIPRGKKRKSEHDATWIYSGKDVGEIINDLEDRIEFINEDIWNQDGIATDKQKKDLNSLNKELNIARKTQANVRKKKDSPNKFVEFLPMAMEMINSKKKEKEKESDMSPMPQNSPNKQAIDNIESGRHHYRAYKYHDDYGTGENAVSKKEERKTTRKWKKEHGVKGKTGGRYEKKLEKKAARKLKRSEKSQAKYIEALAAYYDDDINNKKDWKKLKKARKKYDKRRDKATSAELKVRHNRELASVKGDKRNQVELSKAYSVKKLPEMQKVKTPNKIYDKSGKRRKNYKY